MIKIYVQVLLQHLVTSKYVHNAIAARVVLISGKPYSSIALHSYHYIESHLCVYPLRFFIKRSSMQKLLDPGTM